MSIRHASIGDKMLGAIGLEIVQLVRGKHAGWYAVKIWWPAGMQDFPSAYLFQSLEQAHAKFDYLEQTFSKQQHVSF